MYNSGSTTYNGGQQTSTRGGNGQGETTFSTDPNTPLSFTPNMTEPDEKTLNMLREKFKQDFSRFVVSPIPVYRIPQDSLSTTITSTTDEETPQAISRTEKCVGNELDVDQQFIPSTPTKNNINSRGTARNSRDTEINRSSEISRDTNDMIHNDKGSSYGSRRRSDQSVSQHRGEASESRSDFERKIPERGEIGDVKNGIPNISANTGDRSISHSEELFNEVLTAVNNFPNCSNVIDDGYSHNSMGSRPRIYTGRIQIEGTDENISQDKSKHSPVNNLQDQERQRRQNSEEYNKNGKQGDNLNQKNENFEQNVLMIGTGTNISIKETPEKLAVNRKSRDISDEHTYNRSTVAKTSSSAKQLYNQNDLMNTQPVRPREMELRDINSDDDRGMDAESRENLDKIIQNKFATSLTPTEPDNITVPCSTEDNKVQHPTRMETINTYYSLKQIKTGSVSSFTTTTGFVNPAIPNTTIVNSTTTVNLEPREITDKVETCQETGKTSISVASGSNVNQNKNIKLQSKSIEHNSDNNYNAKQTSNRDNENQILPPFPVQPADNNEIDAFGDDKQSNDSKRKNGTKLSVSVSSASRSSSSTVPIVVQKSSPSTPPPGNNSFSHKQKQGGNNVVGSNQSENDYSYSSSRNLVDKQKEEDVNKDEIDDVDTIELDEYSNRSRKVRANSRDEDYHHAVEKIEIPRNCQHMYFESLLSVDNDKFYRELHDTDYKSSSSPFVSSATSIQNIKIRNSALVDKNRNGTNENVLEMRINIVCNVLGLVDNTGASTFLKVSRTERLNVLEKLLERNIFKILPNETAFEHKIIADDKNNKYIKSNAKDKLQSLSDIENRQVSSIIVRIPPQNEYYLRIAFCPPKNIIYTSTEGEKMIEMDQLLKQYFQEYIRCSSFIESTSMSKTISSLNNILNLKTVMSVFIHTTERIYRIGPHTGSVLLKTDIRRMFTKPSIPLIRPLNKGSRKQSENLVGYENKTLERVEKESKAKAKTIIDKSNIHGEGSSISSLLEAKLPRNVITISKIPEPEHEEEYEEQDELHKDMDDKDGEKRKNREAKKGREDESGGAANKRTGFGVPVFVKPSTLLFRQDCSIVPLNSVTQDTSMEKLTKEEKRTFEFDTKNSNQPVVIPQNIYSTTNPYTTPSSQLIKFKFCLNKDSVENYNENNEYMVRFEIFEKRFNINNVNNSVSSRKSGKSSTIDRKDSYETDNNVNIKTETNTVPTSSYSKSVNIIYGLDNIIYTDNKGKTIIDNKTRSTKIHGKDTESHERKKNPNSITVISDKSSFKIRPIDITSKSVDDEVFNDYQESIVLKNLSDGVISSLEVTFSPNQYYLSSLLENKDMSLIFGAKLVASLYSLTPSIKTTRMHDVKRLGNSGNSTGDIIHINESISYSSSNKLIAEFQAPLWGIVQVAPAQLGMQQDSAISQKYQNTTKLITKEMELFASTLNSQGRQVVNGIIINPRRVKSDVGIGIELKMLSLRSFPTRVTLKTRGKELYNFVIFARERRTLKLELGNISDLVILTIVCTDECLRQIATLTGTWIGLNTYACATSSVTDLVIE